MHLYSNETSEKTHYDLLSVLLLAVAIIPYFSQFAWKDYSLFIQALQQEYLYSSEYLAAIRCLQTFCSAFSPLFRFTSSAFTLYLGALLLKRQFDIRKPVILCILFQIASLLSSITILKLPSSSPESIMGLYTDVTSVIQAATDLCGSVPNLLYFYERGAMLQIVSSLIVILVCCFLIGKTHNTTKGHSTAGIPLVLVSVPIFWMLENMLPLLINGQGYSRIMAEAQSIASSIFRETYCYFFLIFMLCTLVISILCTEETNKFTNFALAVMALIMGAIMYLSVIPILNGNTTPTEALSLSALLLQRRIIGGILLLISFIFWFGSIARHKQPLWSQILVPLVLPTLYVICEVVCIITFDYAIVPSGMMIVSFLLIVTSFLRNKKRQSTRKQQDC